MDMEFIGPLCFGLVVGWVVYRTLRRAPTNGVSDIASVIAAIGGAGVTAFLGTDHKAFHPYSVGLAIGFFGYAIIAAMNPNIAWLGEGTPVGRQQTGIDPAGKPL